MKGRHRLIAPLVALAALAAPGCSKKPEDAPQPPVKAAASPAPARKASASGEVGLRPETDFGARHGEGAKPVPASADAAPPRPVAGRNRANTDDLLAADANFEAWFKKYGLDLNDPKMLDADPDHDGFTNREEFLAGTDPLDPASHPGVHKEIRQKEYHEVQFPFILTKVEGETAHFERSDEAGKKEAVKAGQAIPGSPYRVVKVQKKSAYDKDGHPFDDSQATVEQTETKEKTDLVIGLPSRSKATTATLSAPDGSRSITVRLGQSFQWTPGGPVYKVIDLRPEQTILRQEDTGEMWTVKKL